MKPEDKTPVGTRSDETEEHLRSCPRCAKEALILDEMIDSLEMHKDVFCPEEWELHDYAFHGEDPTGEIGPHVGGCPACQEAVAALQSCREKPTPAPRKLIVAAESHYWTNQGTSNEYGIAASEAGPEKRSDSLIRKIAKFFEPFLNVPVMVAATACAGILLVIFLYPRGHSETMVALSSSTWGRIPGLTLMSPDKLKVATLIIIHDNPKNWPQKRVDSLYQALKPTREMKRTHTFVTPGEVKESLGPETKTASCTNAVDKIRRSLGAALVSVVTIKAEGDTYQIGVDLVDGQDSHVIKAVYEKKVPAQDLQQQVVRLVHSSL